MIIKGNLYFINFIQKIIKCLNYTNEDLYKLEVINNVYYTIYAVDMLDYAPWYSIDSNKRPLNELYAQLIDHNSKNILLSTEYNNVIRSAIIQLQNKGYTI